MSLRPKSLSSFPLLPAVAMFAVGWVVLAWPWLSGRVTLPWDAKSQFHPQLQFLARSLAAGESPFWTTNVFAGWPQIADPQSLIFSPLHWLLALVEPNPGFRAADAVVFVALFLGGVGIILFFRDRQWHLAGALVAALAFAFGCSAAARVQHVGQIMSLGMLPLAFWLLSRALERGSVWAGAGAGVVAGLLAIGRDQVAFLSLYLLAGFVVWHWLSGPDRMARMRASAIPLAVGAVAGLVVVIVPLTMTALLAAHSNRPMFDFVSAGRGSLHPAHLLTFVFADLFGANDPTIPYWGPPSFPWGPTDLFLAQNMGQLYAGALPLVALIGFGLVRGAVFSRDVLFFTTSLVVVLLYALGWYTPVFRVMFAVVPGVTLFRRPADATFVLGFLVAVLAGYSVHRFLSGTLPIWHTNRRHSGAVRRTEPGIQMQAHGVGQRRLIELAIALALVATALALAYSVGAVSAALWPLALGIGWAGGAIVALLLARRLAQQRTASAAALLLAAFTTLDLAWNNAPNESTGLPPGVYDALRPETTNETVALIERKLGGTIAPDRRDRIEMIGIGYHWPNLGLSHGFDHLFGQNPLRLQEFAAATGVGDTVATPDQRTFSPLFPSYRSTLADLFGVRFIATGVPVEEIDRSLQPGDLTLIARTPDAYVYENPRALPRVLLETDWRLADFASLLASGGWPDVDPAKTVLLEHEPAGVTRSSDAGGNVRFTRYDNTEVVIAVDAPKGGLVVLNDVWHPWWRASVDNTPADILKANVLFRAVAVPPGRHVVRFTFAPLLGMWEEVLQTWRQ